MADRIKTSSMTEAHAHALTRAGDMDGLRKLVNEAKARTNDKEIIGLLDYFSFMMRDDGQGSRFEIRRSNGRPKGAWIDSRQATEIGDMLYNLVHHDDRTREEAYMLIQERVIHRDDKILREALNRAEKKWADFSASMGAISIDEG